MKNCILTPTYEGHFKYIGKYLDSYKKYCGDSNETFIAFVLSNSTERDQFEAEFASYIREMPIETYDVEEFFKLHGVTETSDSILKKYRHTSYQMLKKFYSMLSINADRFLVLDSEAAWISEMNMDMAFDEFFRNPYIVVSNFETRTMQSTFLNDHFDATNFILGYPMKKMPFEHFIWFYNKSLIEDIIATYGQPYDMMIRVYNWEMETKKHSVGLMETMLCLNYIYENASNLCYKVLQAEDELLKYLGKNEMHKYVDEFFTTTDGGQLGILEFPCDRLRRNNVKKLAQLFLDNHIYITRCDSVTIFNKKYIDYFLQKASIKILAVGQEHIYLPDMKDENVKKIILFTTAKDVKIRIKKAIKKIGCHIPIIRHILIKDL